MRVVSLNCNECGAPLEVPAKTRYVTCDYCKSRLEIHRSGNAVYSEVLERIEVKTDQIADDVQTIKVQNELEQLDREWMMNRGRYQVRGRDGELSVPTRTGSILGGIAIIVFGGAWTIIASGMGAPKLFPIFGIFFILAGLVQCVRNLSLAEKYSKTQSRYRRERRKVANRLHQSRLDP